MSGRSTSQAYLTTTYHQKGSFSIFFKNRYTVGVSDGSFTSTEQHSCGDRVDARGEREKTCGGSDDHGCLSGLSVEHDWGVFDGDELKLICRGVVVVLCLLGGDKVCFCDLCSPTLFARPKAALFFQCDPMFFQCASILISTRNIVEFVRILYVPFCPTKVIFRSFSLQLLLTHNKFSTQ